MAKSQKSKKNEIVRAKRLVLAQSASARWRSEPATRLQWRVLRKIEAERKITIEKSITKAAASELIRQRFDENPRARRAHRRALARREGLEFGTAKVPGDWRFGEQDADAERAEIQSALQAGRADEYTTAREEFYLRSMKAYGGGLRPC